MVVVVQVWRRFGAALFRATAPEFRRQAREKYEGTRALPAAAAAAIIDRQHADDSRRRIAVHS